MSDSSATQAAPAGYRLGDPIALEDLLALPPDGRRYTRDEQGRLTLMAPDRADTHRYPLSLLTRILNRSLDDPWVVIQEGGVCYERILELGGRLLPPSRLGRKVLEADVAVFSGKPTYLGDSPHGIPLFAQEGLCLVIELLSRDTWRSDLGVGQAAKVDRWRSYLESGVPEYWVLNVGVEPPCRLPERSGLFLRNAGDCWLPLEGEERVASPGEDALPGLAPLASGRVRSAAVPELVFDLDAYWQQAL